MIRLDQKPPKFKREINLLSIDGGGIFVTPSVIIMEEIEHRLGMPISKIFSAVAGSSGGGLVALGVVKPDEKNKKVPQWTLEEYRRVFIETCQQILENPKPAIAQLVQPKYSKEIKDRISQRIFGEIKLSEALAESVITAYDLTANVPRIFTRQQALDHESRDLTMWKLANMTAAAPGFWPPEEYQIPGSDQVHLMVDGGFVTMNPSMTMMLLMAEAYPETKFNIVSFGVDIPKKPQLKIVKKEHWGQAHWLLKHNVIGALVDAPQGLGDFHMSGICEMLGHSYTRIKVSTAGASLDPDCVTPKNISHLELMAMKWLEENKYQFDGLINSLKRVNAGKPQLSKSP